MRLTWNNIINVLYFFVSITDVHVILNNSKTINSIYSSQKPILIRYTNVMSPTCFTNLSISNAIQPSIFSHPPIGRIRPSESFSWPDTLPKYSPYTIDARNDPASVRDG